MAKLTGVFVLAVTVSVCRGQTAQDQQFREAGVCARCHVISVVEWGMSKHRAVGTGCVACHGASTGHVADERNNVKPERIPHGAAITVLCRSCHTGQKRDGCESCHHVHALVNPNKPAVAPDEHHDELAASSKHVRPVAPRRLNPALPGFEIRGNEVDPASGLPRSVVVSGLGIAMVLVPEGDVDMGSDRFKSAQPVHTVHVGAFYLAESALTQAEWATLMGSNPSFRQGAQYPVDSISWKDAQSLVGAVNRRVAGAGFRLPTEAEWERAARAGNPALRDLFKNVWQWCSSLARPFPYDPNDGREDLEADGLRIVRGGSYADSSEWSDPGARHAERPDVRLKWNGMRLARSIPE